MQLTFHDRMRSVVNVSWYGVLAVLQMIKDIKGSAANVQDMVGSVVQVSGKCFQCAHVIVGSAVNAGSTANVLGHKGE